MLTKRMPDLAFSEEEIEACFSRLSNWVTEAETEPEHPASTLYVSILNIVFSAGSLLALTVNLIFVVTALKGLIRRLPLGKRRQAFLINRSIGDIFACLFVVAIVFASVRTILQMSTKFRIVVTVPVQSSVVGTCFFSVLNRP